MNGEEKWVVGIDIGGTAIKLAFIRPQGEMIYKWEIETNHLNHGEEIPNCIAKEIEKKRLELGLIKGKILAVGAGAPGSVDVVTGIVNEAINLRWSHRYPLQQKLEDACQLPVVIDNDANCAALGEMWQGAGISSRNLVFVTIGTGIGSGIIINGHIVHGAGGAAGEIGHVTVIPVGGALCNCGKMGCLETVASATGIVRQATALVSEASASDDGLSTLYKQNGVFSARDIFELAKTGDYKANTVVQTSLSHLGIALANVANTLNPETIVIGGGVSRAGDFLLSQLNLIFHQHAFQSVKETTVLTLASKGNDAGVLGAAWLAKQQYM
ncbi:ROK family glucokinase [Cytobacillus purgationiresistens]|nr:ROK family glucokinase [Cytobacillus purgationiresistens]